VIKPSDLVRAFCEEALSPDSKRRDLESQLWDSFFFSFYNGARGGSLSPQDCLVGSVAMIANCTVLCSSTRRAKVANSIPCGVEEDELA